MNTPQITFTTGGTVQAGGGCYLARQADEDLLQLCREGRFAYILTARQMGKSSLMVRTVERLTAENIRAVMIDLTQIGTQVTPEQWYLGLLAMIEEQLQLATDAVAWWQANAHLGLTQRLTRFLQEVLLREITDPIVIFVDEIDTTLSLDFTDDFFAAIRSYYNARATAPEFQRLSFVLIGVATPGDLIRDPQRTPFNIGQRVDLTDFTRAEAQPLADGLQLPPADAAPVLDRVLHWTNGHPYLTQRLCQALVDERRPHWTSADVDRAVERTFFGAMSEQDNNLQFVRDMLTKRAQDVEGVLTTYRDVRSGNRPVPDEEQLLNKSHLKLSGIVRRQPDGALWVSNRIYETVFDDTWVRGHLPVNWRRRFRYAAVAMLAAIMILTPATVVNAVKNNQLEEVNRRLRETNQKLIETNRKLTKANTDLEQQSAELNETLITAQENENKATVFATDAILQKRLAEINALETKYQRDLGQSRELTANAEIQASFDPDLSLSLINQALHIAPTSQSEKALREYLLERPIEFVLRGHTADVLSAVYSPDGRFILTASDDGTARIWSVLSAQPVSEIKAHNASVGGATYSPDGQSIVTVSDDHTARVWKVRDGMMVTEFKGHLAPVTMAAYSPNGSYIVTASLDGTAQVWSATSGQIIAKLIGHSAPLTSAAYSPNGHFIVTTGDDNTARVWSAENGQFLIELKGHTKAVMSAAYSPDCRFIVTASLDDTARVWNTNGLLVTVLKGHSDSLWGAAFSPNGRYIVTASHDNTAKIWNAANGGFVSELRGHTAPIRSAAYSPDGRFIVTASADDTARVWRAESRQSVAELKGHTNTVWRSAFSPNGRFIVTASGDNTARIWNIESEQMVTQLNGHTSTVRSVAYSPDGRFIVTASADRAARVWDATSGQAVAELKGHRGSIWNAAYSPDGRYIVTASIDRTARVWNADTKQVVIELKGHKGEVWDAAYSPDGRFIVTASFDRTARIWDAANGQLVGDLKGHTDSVVSAAYSLDGRNIVTASEDHTALVWNALSKQRIAELKGHKEAIWRASFSPDGRFILTASGDGTTRVWNALSGQMIVELKGHTDSVRSAVYSPDGRFIVTASADRTARVWPQILFEPFEETLARLRRLSPRELTEDERARYLPDAPPANRQRKPAGGRR